MNSVNVAVIATGGRAQCVIGYLLKQAKGKVKIVSIYDPSPEMIANALKVWGIDSQDVKICDSEAEAIEHPGVEWVLIFSPNYLHCKHITMAFAAGKNVFAEKPLATTIEDCQAIYEAHRASGKLFMTGFVLRYAQIYCKAKEILDSGKLGKILSINADENIAINQGIYIISGWRRFRKFTGPQILEKCCHDIDILNWLCGSLPSKVAGFGGLDFFLPENERLLSKLPENAFDYHSESGGERKKVFTLEKDVFDTQVGILLYRNGVKVQFQTTMHNIIPERRMYISCSEGTMILEVYSNTLRYKALGDEEETLLDYSNAKEGHGGGDLSITAELLEAMLSGKAPKTSGDEGLKSAVTALALDESMCNGGQLFDLEPVLKSLNR